MNNVFTISAGTPFAYTLAAELHRRAAGKPEALARMRVLLPTRRAGRAFRQSFLQLTNGQPLLLPRLQPVGDVDEEELAFETAGGDIPPAIAPLRRQMLLAQLVMRRDSAEGRTAAPAPALALAAELARLLDRLHTEGLDISRFAGLAGAEFAAHWQVTLKFLEIVSEAWPTLLAAEGAIDPADRRNRLLRAQAAAWAARPPQTPVIAAGITGSIPAAAELLRVVAQLPQGTIILPGLDLAVPEADLPALGPTHPQASLEELLRRLDVPRDKVRTLGGAQMRDGDRAWLAREIMRPAATTAAWAALRDDGGAGSRLRAALGEVDTDPLDSPRGGVLRLDAASPQEEALAVALLLRKALETPGRTAALVTPDRELARRVAGCCRRWGLAIDDSAGLPLGATPVGIFLRLILQAIASDLSPSTLLALLRHDLCRLGMAPPERRAAINALELKLRGPKPPPGLAGLRRRAQGRGDAALEAIETAFAPLLALPTNASSPLESWLDALLRAAEALATMPEEPGGAVLWAGEAGDAAATLLAEWRAEAALLPPLTAADCLAALSEVVRPVTVRPAWGTHARLAILGRLEARLLQPDLVILGGLNEGSWPPEPGHDPWLSRPMLAQLGLPPPEQAVGFAAHDFVQGFAAPVVALTRARRAAGAPTVPSRWLQRLDAVLEAAGLDPAILHKTGQAYLDWARVADQCASPQPAARPAPTPPVAARPRELSVTEIDTWLRDPYQIYARHVLDLRALHPLEQPPDAAARGTLLHAALRDTIAAPLAGLERRLLERGRFHIAQRADDLGFWEFWWPRFTRIASWVAEHEAEWRRETTEIKAEIKGHMTLPTGGGAFTLKARADRIDRRRDGSYALIDYKSGGTHSKAQIASGDAPQLGLEAMLLAGGHFAGLPPAPVSSLNYWVLKGDRDAGRVVASEDDVAGTIETVRAGLLALIDAFDDPATPYMSVPDADHAPRHSDYAQLARLQEWTALGEAEEAV